MTARWGCRAGNGCSSSRAFRRCCSASSPGSISPIGPAKADWLTAEQKAWLAAQLDRETAAKQAASHLTLGQALASPKVIALSVIYFGFVAALYGMQFWLPTIVKAFGFSNAQTGFVIAVPYLFGTVAMILWARHSDATRERVMHVGRAAAVDRGRARHLRSTSPTP